jgi:hypothetical protein
MMSVGIRVLIVAGALGVALGGDVAPSSGAQLAARANWAETKWPFPIDQWGRGRAFRCIGGDCGRELNLYVRPKLGFCNCTTGVADDAEVDRVADLELLGKQIVPLADGKPVTIGWMKGRSRAYAVDGPKGARRAALAVAFNDKCDVVVATVVADRDLPRGAEAAALELLNGETILQWTKLELGI